MATADGKTQILKSSYETLGITSKAASDAIVADAVKARDTILGSDLATDFEKKTAVYKALKAQVDAAKSAGQEIPNEQLIMLDKMEKDLGNQSGLPRLKSAWDELAGNMKAAFKNAGNGIVDALMGEGSFGQVGLRLLKDLGTAVLDSFVQPAMDAISDFVTSALKGLLKPALEEAAGWFAGLGKSAADAFGSGASSAGSTAGSAGGGVGGGAGAASGSAGMAVAGLVAGFVAAGASVVSAIYDIRQEGTLNAIEESTRYTKILTQDHLPKLTNEFASALPAIHDRLMEMRSIGLGVYVQDGWSFGQLPSIDNSLNTIAGWDLGSKISTIGDSIEGLKGPLTINVSVPEPGASGGDIAAAIAAALRNEGVVS